MKQNLLDNLKLLLLESAICAVNFPYNINNNDTVNQKIRKCLRTYAKAKSHAYIKIEKNDLKPTLKGERGYWYIFKTDLVKTIKDKMIFHSKPGLFYHHSDYCVEVGEQWLTNTIQGKEIKSLTK